MNVALHYFRSIFCFRMENCYRCIVMHMKHPNVLQYKESTSLVPRNSFHSPPPPPSGFGFNPTNSFPAWCITGSSKPTLPSICGDLTSDAILISLFRTGAAPMPCPFKGPLEFTYSHGEAECKSPLSAAETCTQESRLLFRYQACANVLSSESVGK